jgi:hypothetical protein
LKRGRSERIRTFDPLIPNQMRYQAALRSDKNEMIAFYLYPCNRNYPDRGVESGVAARSRPQSVQTANLNAPKGDIR